MIKLSPIDDAFAKWRGEAPAAKTPGKIEPERRPDPVDDAFAEWIDEEPTLVDRKRPA
jgi:hypothetical protein